MPVCFRLSFLYWKIWVNDAVNSLDQQTQQNASVATQSHEIAILIDDIAKLIVSNADEKEFVGKNEIKSKNKNNFKRWIKFGKDYTCKILLKFVIFWKELQY